ncbi:hypothetical protein BDF14DRAFT_1718343 [Spinellus fusiger]|nr:hypothetical protein BDF14DRAFT_1718343 [Spinellus fusiger]
MSAIIGRTRAMVERYMGKLDPSHDILHVDRVTRLAMHLAKSCVDQGHSVNMELVELAALCHDVGDRKYYEGTETGGELIYTFLTKEGYEPTMASSVSRIVDNIGFRKELGWDDAKDDIEEVKWRNKCVELHIVQDADKLDAIGAFGVLRCAAFSGAKNNTLYRADEDPLENMTKDQYELQTKKKSGTAINHFHEKLFRLKTMMRTEKGKIMAEERDRFMRVFVQQVEDEYNLLK